MGVRGQEASIEERLRQVKRGERRVAEMECHVQCLREKLCRLEKMLPPSDDIERFRFKYVADDDVVNGKREMHGTAEICPIEELAMKEKLLRKQIYDLECTEQAYIQKILDQKENPPAEGETKPSHPNCMKNRETVEKERLRLLESYNQKIYNNMHSCEKNFVILKQEANNSSQVPDNTRRDSFKEQRQTPNYSPSREIIPKCNNCTASICDKCEPNLRNNNRKNNQEIYELENEIPLRQEKCSYNESSLSTDSEESCDECQHIKEHIIKHCDCNVDNESEVSNDDQTQCSERSKCTCYCSKVESHEDLRMEIDTDECNAKDTNEDKCRGGLDAENEDVTNFCVEETDKPPAEFTTFQNAIADHMKLMKVEELREGLERLKIRNRNLKDFLQSLENPLSLMNKPSETISACTDVSSCYTMDIAKQTRSGLLTVVRVLESKCRNKDAIIVALADELKTNSSKKLRLKGLESSSFDKVQSWDSFAEKKKMGRGFTKKDSAIGFLVFIMILISHIKRSELISYLIEAKQSLKESPHFVRLMAEMEKLPMLLNIENITILAKRFEKITIDQWEEAKSWFTESSELFRIEMRYHMDLAIPFLIEHQFYVVSVLSAIITTALITRYRKTITRCFVISDVMRRASIKDGFLALWRIFYERMITSKIFWFFLGLCFHTLWNSMVMDYNKLVDLFSIYYGENMLKPTQENPQPLEVADVEPVCELPGYVDYYCWIVCTLSEKFQSLVDFLCYIRYRLE